MNRELGNVSACLVLRFYVRRRVHSILSSHTYTFDKQSGPQTALDTAEHIKSKNGRRKGDHFSKFLICFDSPHR